MNNNVVSSTAGENKPAVILAETGQAISHEQLDKRARRLASFLAEHLEEGEVIAILLSNRLEYFDACFAARHSGLYYVPVSTHLTGSELAYILKDSGAKILITEERFLSVVDSLTQLQSNVPDVLNVDTHRYQQMVCSGALLALPDRALGLDFAYSSGTTGRPKGIRHAMRGDSVLSQAVSTAGWTAFFTLDSTSIYLSPAPLYHSAPLRFSIRCVANGGTVVTMRKFDAEGALAAMQRYKVTHSQWVPTMFVRLLSLPEATRHAYDLSHHRQALHAAAPCPIDIKRKMIDWWGPIIWEYYTGSERAGATVISSLEWLSHPGSVGQAVQGVIHIVDDDGHECPVGVDGLVCFEGGPRFRYHNDDAKTQDAYTPQGWATFGDIGHVDADGYLFLTDRRANMIISGGVNIYPQEVENLLLEHPLVHDVAVIGIPNSEYGEEVKAVVELKDPNLANEDTASLLIQYCRNRLSHVKCPRSVDFASSLPRSETGKLLKRLVRDHYRAKHTLSSSTI